MSLLLALVSAEEPPDPDPPRGGSGSTRKRGRFEVDRFSDFPQPTVTLRNDDEDCLMLLMI